MASSYKISVYKAVAQIKHNSRVLPEKNPSYDIRQSVKNDLLAMQNDRIVYTTADALESKYKARVLEGNPAKRKDLNTLIEWVVTVPKNVPAEREKDFFNSVIRFTTERYGVDNFIGAAIHRDEPTARPHIHLDFVPRVKKLETDKQKKAELRAERDAKIAKLKANPPLDMTVADFKNKIDTIKKECKEKIAQLPKLEAGLKISAKEVLTLKELKTFHPDLQRYCTEQLGFTPEICTGITKAQGGNKTRGAYRLEEMQKKYEIACRKANMFFKIACLDAILDAYQQNAGAKMQEITAAAVASLNKKIENASKSSTFNPRSDVRINVIDFKKFLGTSRCYSFAVTKDTRTHEAPETHTVQKEASSTHEEKQVKQKGTKMIR